MTDQTTVSALKQARRDAGLSQNDVVALLRAQRQRQGKMPPKDASLKRMYVEWEAGRVHPADWISELCAAFRLPPATLGLVRIEAPARAADDDSALAVSSLDLPAVELLSAETNHLRLMDRTYGAAILPLVAAHIDHVQQVVRDSLPGKAQEASAATLADAAAMGGWITLDSGDPRKCWNLHDTAKAAARLAGDTAALAHVIGQQSYALLDTGHPADALTLVRHAQELSGKTPPRLRAWLAAVEAECSATTGDARATRRLLDRAGALLPAGDAEDPELPYLMLDEANLARWRGDCLAILGAGEAIEDLSTALAAAEADGSTRRAQTGLHVDLAVAFKARGDLAMSLNHAETAADLAGRTGSARQRAKIARLLA